jgi:hypothetical protein
MLHIPPSPTGEARCSGHDLDPLQAGGGCGKEPKPHISRTDGGVSPAAPAAAVAVKLPPPVAPPARVITASAARFAGAAYPREELTPSGGGQSWPHHPQPPLLRPGYRLLRPGYRLPRPGDPRPPPRDPRPPPRYRLPRPRPEGSG